VVVEGDLAPRLVRAGLGLAHVVEQRRQPEDPVRGRAGPLDDGDRGRGAAAHPQRHRDPLRRQPQLGEGRLQVLGEDRPGPDLHAVPEPAQHVELAAGDEAGVAGAERPARQRGERPRLLGRSGRLLIAGHHRRSADEDLADPPLR
jgi:hypothetical protein